MTVLAESVETIGLSEMYVAAGAVPAEYDNDARHIAVASVHHIPVIVSWNFRHLVNIETKRKEVVHEEE